eukprot:8364203-Pyramimonas_sp.AAC.1
MLTEERRVRKELYEGPGGKLVDGLPPVPSLDGPFADFWSVEFFVLEIQPFDRALVFFPVIFDVIPARHLDLSSI